MVAQLFTLFLYPSFGFAVWLLSGALFIGSIYAASIAPIWIVIPSSIVVIVTIFSKKVVYILILAFLFAPSGIKAIAVKKAAAKNASCCAVISHSIVATLIDSNKVSVVLSELFQ